MNVGQLKKLLEKVDDSIEVGTLGPGMDGGLHRVRAVIISDEERFTTDFSFVKRTILYLNEFAQVASYYHPRILVPDESK